MIAGSKFGKSSTSDKMSTSQPINKKNGSGQKPLDTVDYTVPHKPKPYRAKSNDPKTVGKKKSSKTSNKGPDHIARKHTVKLTPITEE